MDDLLKMREKRLEREKNTQIKNQSIATLIVLVGSIDNAIPIKGTYKNLKEIYDKFHTSLDSETAYITIKGKRKDKPFQDTFRMSEIVGMRFMEGELDASGD